jgi:hypothetical protein
MVAKLPAFLTSAQLEVAGQLHAPQKSILFFKRLVVGGARVCLDVNTQTGILHVPEVETWSYSSQPVMLLTAATGSIYSWEA